MLPADGGPQGQHTPTDTRRGGQQTPRKSDSYTAHFSPSGHFMYVIETTQEYPSHIWIWPLPKGISPPVPHFLDAMPKMLFVTLHRPTDNRYLNIMCSMDVSVADGVEKQ